MSDSRSKFLAAGMLSEEISDGGYPVPHETLAAPFADLALGMVCGESPQQAPVRGSHVAAVHMPLETPRVNVSVATDREWQEANEKAAICREFERLQLGGLSLTMAAAALGKSPSWFSGPTAPFTRWKREGLAGLLPQGRGGAKVGDLTAEIEALAWFLPAARFFYLITNRTHDKGSVPEAIRRVVSLPVLPVGWTNAIRARFLKVVGTAAVPICPPALRDQILNRERSGKELVPERIAKSITRKVTSQVIEYYRRPHEAGLKYLNSPGTMMTRRVMNSDEFSFAKAGDILEADDGSINFPVCIPWSMGGTPCADKFGVIVGRFQWLRTIDVGTRFRPGWVFVARQRGGYRGADVLTLLRGITIQHGIWNEYRFERGVWKSNLVKHAIKHLDAKLNTVFSPHSKPFIEGGFNQDWTKLSVHFPQCDLGRYRGDTEEANKLIQSCRAGRHDPRRYFPMLKDAVAAFQAITDEENRTRVNSRNWGSWIPEERWSQQSAERKSRRLDEATAWMFQPYAIEWTVKGMLVGGRVPIFEDMSVPFDFSATWLTEFHGAKLRLHFDPSAPRCIATPVLVNDFNGHRAGEVLPTLQQVNETAGYVRMVLGWAEDPRTLGLKAKQQAAVAMRREVRTVMPGGRSGYSSSEEKSLESAVTMTTDLSAGSASERSDVAGLEKETRAVPDGVSRTDIDFSGPPGAGADAAAGVVTGRGIAPQPPTGPDANELEARERAAEAECPLDYL